MKLNKWVIALCVLGVTAGLALFFLPTILGGLESGILAVVCLSAGLLLFIFSLVVFDWYITKRKRPDLLLSKQLLLMGITH